MPYTMLIIRRAVLSCLDVQNALKVMGKQKSGRIVNITSVVGVTGNAGQVSFGAGRAGRQLCWCVRLVVLRHGVVVGITFAVG